MNIQHLQVLNFKSITKMNRLLISACLLALSFLLLNCAKDEPKKEETKTSVELTVIDGTGAPVSRIVVYLFENPATEESGKDPEQAIESGVTDDQGVVKISLQGMGDLNATPDVYFTVLERALNLEISVLGSIKIDLPDPRPELISEEMHISERAQKYAFGHIPTAFDSELASAEYERWKRLMVTPCGDGLRVVADPRSETRVEAIGFGTILSAYADDQETFDKLMIFYNSKRTPEANNMMAWRVSCDDIEDPGSATDGDIDVAYANIIAHVQWGGDYLNKAREIINLVKENLIIDCDINGVGVKALAPGYSSGQWGGCDMTDIQYYIPGYFRIFAKVTGDNVWDQLADDTYKILNASAHATTGLVPDWQTVEGTPGPGNRAGHYGYDACRVPWRMSLDYMWNGNANAEQWCTKISNWAYGVGASQIVDGYELDGTPIGTNGLNSAFLGSFTVSLMTNDYEKTNNFSKTLKELDDSYWFNLNTRVLYLFTLTGNFWEPEI